MIKEIENKIGQLQYEISCLGLDKEDLTGVSVRTEELKGLVKKLTIPVVSQQRELLDAFCCTMEFDIKHETYEEDINYFLENVKADNCG